MNKFKALKFIIILLLLLNFIIPEKVYAYAYNTNTSKELTLSNLTQKALAQLRENINEDLQGRITYNEFRQKVDNGEVKEAFLEFKDYIYFIDLNDNLYETPNPNSETLKQELLEKDVMVITAGDLVERFDVKDPTTAGEMTWWGWIIILLVFGVGFPILIRFGMMALIAKGEEKEKALTNEKVNNTAGNENSENVKKFNDVAGLKEVKEDVQTLVDFIVNGDKYKEMGAKLPRGVILYGPPGTGKTLLAKAIAGEAGVPFISASGSDFAEMYVGVGAKRIRDLFKDARKQAPCIVFIDEIDAICGKRTGGSENAEDRKTINAILCEMDGFNAADDILVIGATNRIEDLDEAVLRPGRFTNKYCVPLPESFEDRLTIIELYAKNKKIDETVDLKQLAKMTIGCSPAEIENILNESAIIATRTKLNAINGDCIEEAFNKSVLKGHVKKDTFNRKKKELELVAWHEAGHTVAGIILGEDVNKVTILSSTTGAGGATFMIPKKMGLFSTDDLKKKVIGLYAGRCAEQILLGDKGKITTGASNDIERATDIINQMVSIYGMNDKYGMLNLNRLNVPNSVIVEEATVLAKELEEKCLDLLTRHKNELKKVAELLLEHETVYEKDLKFITAREELNNKWTTIETPKNNYKRNKNIKQKRA